MAESVVEITPRSFLKFVFLVAGCLTLFIACGKKDPRVPVENVFPGKAWAQTPVVFKPVKGAGLSAADCARCHPRHVDDWKLSTHAHALQDLQFQAELGKASSPRWLCLNCHIPLGNQRSALVRHLEHGNHLRPLGDANAHYDPKMESESVTCGVCHFRKNTDGETLIIAARDTATAPHPTIADAKALRSRCLDCHNVTAMVNNELVCSFQTGDELAAGYLAGKQDCAGCHMREVNEPGHTPRHRHSFIGGGVAKTIPLMAKQKAAGYVSALDFALEDVAQQSGKIMARLTIHNARAGHRIPTGDPERFLDIRVKLYDARGKQIGEKNERIGQTWQWSPEARKLADNRIHPAEKREIRLEIATQEAAARLETEIRHVRLTVGNAAYMKNEAARAAAPYVQQIREIERHYPFSRLLYSAVHDLKTHGTRVATAEEIERVNAAKPR